MTQSCYQPSGTQSCYQPSGTQSCYQPSGTQSCYQPSGTQSCYQPQWYTVLLPAPVAHSPATIPVAHSPATIPVAHSPATIPVAHSPATNPVAHSPATGPNGTQSCYQPQWYTVLLPAPMVHSPATGPSGTQSCYQPSGTQSCYQPSGTVLLPTQWYSPATNPVAHSPATRAAHRVCAISPKRKIFAGVSGTENSQTLQALHNTPNCNRIIIFIYSSRLDSPATA